MEITKELIDKLLTTICTDCWCRCKCEEEERFEDCIKCQEFIREEEYSKKQKHSYLNSRHDFVKECEKLLKIAKHNVDTCDFVVVEDLEQIEITYKNGDKESWKLEANNLIEIACDIFIKMLYK